MVVGWCKLELEKAWLARRDLRVTGRGSAQHAAHVFFRLCRPLLARLAVLASRSALPQALPYRLGPWTERLDAPAGGSSDNHSCVLVSVGMTFVGGRASKSMVSGSLCAGSVSNATMKCSNGRQP